MHGHDQTAGSDDQVQRNVQRDATIGEDALRIKHSAFLLPKHCVFSFAAVVPQADHFEVFISFFLILNRIAEHVDAKLIPEQAGFRPGKSCTSQLLNLTEHIEDGYEKRLITGAVFVDLSAAYDTVNHRRLLSKVLEMTGDVHLTDLIRTMLENRRFFVALNGKKSRWRRQRNGLPQGSVLAPMLFNIYTNDQPVHADTRSFIYADDLCIASPGNDFNNIEVSLTSALSTMTT